MSRLDKRLERARLFDSTSIRYDSQKNNSRISYLNDSDINDVTKDFEFKLSVLDKASRVSGNFKRVTIGPNAENDENLKEHIFESSPESQNKATVITKEKFSERNINFSIKKILLENEVQRKKEVTKKIEQKMQEMEKSKQDIQNKLISWHTSEVLKKERNKKEKLAQLIAEEEIRAQEIETERKCDEQRRKFQESEEISKKIIPFRERFHSKWKDIANISSSCKDKNSANIIISSHAAKLNQLKSQMDSINQKTRARDLTEADVKIAEMILLFCDEISNACKIDIDQINAIYDEEIRRRESEVKKAELLAQQEALKQKQMLEVKYQQQMQKEKHTDNTEVNAQQFNEPNYNKEMQETSVVDSNKVEIHSRDPRISKGISQDEKLHSADQKEEYKDHSDPELIQMYNSNREFLENFRQKFANLVNLPQMKEFRFECQSAINKRFNRFSKINGSELKDKYETLKLILLGKSNPNISTHPEGEAFCKNLIALKILERVEPDKIKPDTPFLLAAITVALWNEFPDFGEVFMAQYRAKSPFLIPIIFPATNRLDNTYFKLLGYEFNEDGTPEDSDTFLNRLSGLINLYASILVTKQKQNVNKPHPHGLANGWKWLAAILNIDPRFDTVKVCATLLNTFLEVAGNDLWKTYPTQFPKLLIFINSVYYVKLQNANPIGSGPVTRLGVFLNDALKNGSIPPPKGQLPNNFW